jgi:hypothetical protein
MAKYKEICKVHYPYMTLVLTVSYPLHLFMHLAMHSENQRSQSSLMLDNVIGIAVYK